MRTRRVVRPRDRSESSCESFFRRCRLPKKRLAKIHIWALSFYAAIDCHCLPSLRDLHSNLAVITVTLCQNGGAAPLLAATSGPVSLITPHMPIWSMTMWRPGEPGKA
jgi:hypothetical protein